MFQDADHLLTTDMCRVGDQSRSYCRPLRNNQAMILLENGCTRN